MRKLQTLPFETKDLSLCGALVVHKQKIIGTRKEDHVYWFKFEDKNKCEELANRYFFGELPVNAREYQQAMHQLKNIIFTR